MRRVALATLSLLVLSTSSALAQPALRSRANLPTPFSDRTPPPVEALIPEDASAVVLLNTADAVWDDLHRFELFPRYVSVRGMMANLLGFDFDKDLRPWVGSKVAIALVPPSKVTSSNLSQPIVIAPITNDRRVWQFLDMAERRYKATSTERWYKRATIVEWQPIPQAVQKTGNATSVTLASAIWQYRAMRTLSPHSVAFSSPQAASGFELLPTVKPSLAFAVFDEYVVMAESATVLEAYIDNLPEEGSLMENAQFQRTMRQPQYEQSFVVGHGNLGQLLSIINAANQRLVASLPSESSPLLVPQLPPEALAQFKTTTDSIDAYLWAQRDGIQMRYLVRMDRPIAGLPAITPTNHANNLLNRLPASTYLSLNSADLKSIWRLVLATMETQPAFAQSLGELRRLGLQELGLDDHDVFSWMDGEFALCLFPSRKGFLGSTIGMALVVQTSERSAAEAALRKFDAYAQDSQIYSVKPRRLQGRWATSWDAVYANESLLAHSWLDQSTLLITNGTGPMAEIMPKPAMNLASAREFQTAVAPLPKENTGYSYINVRAASNLMFNYVLPQVAPPEVLSTPEMLAMRKTLASIRSISATASHQADRSQVDFFLALRPALPPKRQR